MLVLDHPTAGFRDYSASASTAHVVMAQPAGGPSLERSDPYMEWALRFEQGLKRLDERMRAWSRDPASLADDDVDAPTRQTIGRAVEVINELKVMVMDRVAPATATLLNLKGASLGSGGEISLELAAGPFAVTYRIETDGAVTELIFKHHRLVRRERVRG